MSAEIKPFTFREHAAISIHHWKIIGMAAGLSGSELIDFLWDHYPFRDRRPECQEYRTFESQIRSSFRLKTVQKKRPTRSRSGVKKSKDLPGQTILFGLEKDGTH
jgi:hypothetical protein